MVSENKRGQDRNEKHRFFAWMTVICFFLTMMTGYKKEIAKAIELLEEIKGTYEPLFPIIKDHQYDQLWLNPCISAVGEEAAPEVAEMLKAACNGTVYGQEAIDAFGDGSEGAQFDCLFINGP